MANHLRAIFIFLAFGIMALVSTQKLYAQEQKQEKGVNIIITQSPKIIVKVLEVTDNTCYGESKGAINITASGGYPPYKYYWAHGDTTQDVAGLKAGMYKVAVYDDFSCSDTVEVEVRQPEKLEAQVTDIKDILCYGYNNGSVDIDVKGGVPPYTYSWNNGAQTQDIEGVNSGRFSVLITDANNCQEIVTADVQEKPLIVRSLDDVENIKCNGDSTGSVDISVQGGVPPYSYVWNNGAESEDLRNVPAGTYEVVVKDDAGCTEVSSTKVIEPKPLELSFDEIRDLRCNGDFGGAINMKVEGGKQPYKYAWNNGATTQDIAGIPAGEYSVEVVDNNGCMNTIDTEITQPDALDATLVSASNVSYYGGEDGAIDIEVAGGVPPYTYKWSNESEEQDISGLKAGSYTVRITDNIGCAKIMNVKLDQPQPLIVNLDNKRDILCFGEETGGVNISVFGGVAPYSYQWSNGASTQDISEIGAGTYSVVVTDANGHTQQLEATIEQPLEFKAGIIEAKNILCHNAQTGSINVEVEGGVLPYRYRWNNGDDTQDLVDIPAGDYSVKITDNNQCELSLDTVIAQPEPLMVSLRQKTNILCYGDSTGAIDINVVGGVEPYKYNWNNGATSEDLETIGAGNYIVEVRDNNGCTTELEVNISQPTLMEIVSVDTRNVDCNENTTGAINIEVNGGVTPYQYSWSNGSSTQDIAELAAGTYRVEVKDANGCTDNVSREITEPAPLVTSVGEVTDILCFDDAKGAINVEVNGGVEPYRYRWSNGEVSQDIAGVKAGNYSLQIQDANGCRDSLSATIDQNALLVPNVVVTNINCNGNTTGAVDVSVEGGVSPYTYAWSNGKTTQDLNNVAAGTYSATIKDAVGCVKTVDAQVVEPPKFVASIDSKRDILCFNEKSGNVNVRVYGGVKPYTFNWSNGDSTQNLDNIGAGDYSLTAVDANGCSQTLSTSITQPTEIQYSVANVDNVLCYGNAEGNIDVAVSGGVGPYQYQWSNGASTQDLVGVVAGQYSLQIKDANGCVHNLQSEITQPGQLQVRVDTVEHIKCFGDLAGAINISVIGGVEPYKYSWSNGATSQNISAIPAGSYTVTVEDANGCIEVVSANVKQPTPLRAKITDFKNLDCFGDTDGAVFVDVIGGVKPYKYQWSNGFTSQNLENVGAGTYTLDITDANGCTQQITATLEQPSQLVTSLTSQSDVLCYGGNDGTVNITVIGGTTPYQYNWSNGTKLQDLAGVPAGNYSVGITDANGCKDSSIVVQINEPPLLEASFANIQHIKKHGEEDGAIDLAVRGGVAPYSYSWSNGTSEQDISNVAGGNYSVKVVDNNGCEVELNTMINQPPPLVVSLVALEDIKCNGNNTGNITLDVQGGVKPYNFAWSNGDSTQNLKDVPAGDYSVVVTDANGNQQTLETKIAQPTPIVVSTESVNDLLCFNDNRGSVNVTVTGGVVPYQYQWSNGALTQDLDGLSAGVYQLTVTDGNGCQKQVEAEVNEPDLFVVKIDEISPIKCTGQREGSINLTVEGGVEPYNYYWSNGEKTKDIDGLLAGDYTVKVTDANGCENNLSASITEPSELQVAIASVTNNLCYGQEKGAVNVDISGGTTPYSYTWSNGDTTQNLVDVASGEYELTVADANGCSKVINTRITEPELLTASIAEIQDVNCNNDVTGGIEVEIAGGRSPYKFSWSNGASVQNLSNIASGQYDLNVEDANGCVATLSAEVKQPEVLTVMVDTVQNILCHGDSKGFIDINVEGGVFPYTYVWSNGDNTEDLVNVMAGSYAVKVKDANGCIEDLTAQVEQPAELIIRQDSLVNITCAGDETGLIKVSVEGGEGPYEYKWNTGQTTPGISGIGAGTYRVLVTDANGCQGEFTTEVNEPSKLISSIDAITDIRCNSDSSGIINVTVREGTAPYSFEWSNGATTEDIRNVSAGDYSLTITEGNGCKTVLNATIEQPTMFYASIKDVKDVKCFGNTTGAVTVDASGGVTPYTFNWSNGSTEQNIFDVGADSYSVMVTDANGCIRTLNAEIEEPPLLTMRIDSVYNVKCCGDKSGAIFISVEGGVEPYQYKWSNGETTQDITNLELGVYTVEVTDANGCTVATPDDMSLYEEVVSKGKFTTRDINFDIGKSVIRPESFTTINRIASFMKEHPDISFRIDGHTDSDGSAEFNQKLSEDRAKAIRNALIKFGIRASRLDTKGWGEEKPIATNTTQEGKAENRRVEFVVLTGTLDGELIESEGTALQK